MVEWWSGWVLISRPPPAQVLEQATPRSLVILDELGRGTSTHDGVAIAHATLRHLVQRVGCATLFVTHYPQLAALSEDPDIGGGKIANLHMSFVEGEDEDEDEDEDGIEGGSGGGSADGKGGGSADGKGGGSAGGEGGSGSSRYNITFLYKAVDGQAHKSYGLNVAKVGWWWRWRWRRTHHYNILILILILIKLLLNVLSLPPPIPNSNTTPNPPPTPSPMCP